MLSYVYFGTSDLERAIKYQYHSTTHIWADRV